MKVPLSFPHLSPLKQVTKPSGDRCPLHTRRKRTSASPHTEGTKKSPDKRALPTPQLLHHSSSPSPAVLHDCPLCTTPSITCSGLLFLWVLVSLWRRPGHGKFFCLFIYLFLAVLGLCCGVQASHCGGFSCCGAWALGTRASVVVVPGLSSCGAWAQ